MLRALIGEQTWSSPGHARLEISRFHNTTRAPSSSPGTPPSSSLIHPHQLFILPLCRAHTLAFASRKKIPLIHETKNGRKAKGGQDPGMVARKALAGESRPSHRARQRTRRQRRQQRPDRVGENSRRDGQKKNKREPVLYKRGRRAETGQRRGRHPARRATSEKPWHSVQDDGDGRSTTAPTSGDRRSRRTQSKKGIVGQEQLQQDSSRESARAYAFLAAAFLAAGFATLGWTGARGLRAGASA